MKEPAKNGKALTAKQRTARRLGINRELGYLRASLRLGMRRGLVNPNVIARLQFPIDTKVEKLSVRTGTIDAETYDKIYVASAPHFRPILTTCLYTGVRSKEIKWIRREQVDFTEKVIHLRRGETKNGDPRTVPMSDQVWAELKKWEEITKREWPEAEFFFHYEGRQNNDFKKAWQRAVKRAGVTGVRFHDSRRTVISSLFEDGQAEVDIRKVTDHKGKILFQYDQSTKGAMARIRSAQNRLQGSGDAKPATATDDTLERLERLAAMLKDGVLTAKEFSLLKSKLIA